MSHSPPAPPRRSPWWKFKSLHAYRTDRRYYRDAIGRYDRTRAANGLRPVKHPGWVRRHKIVSAIVGAPVAFLALLIALGFVLTATGQTNLSPAELAPVSSIPAATPSRSTTEPTTKSPLSTPSTDTAAVEKAHKAAEAKAKAEADAEKKAAEAKAKKAAVAEKKAAEAKALKAAEVKAQKVAKARAQKAAEAKAQKVAKAKAQKAAEAKAQKAAAASKRAQQRAAAQARANQPVKGVHPGAFCSAYDRLGTTSTGVQMRCSTTSTDDRYRWRRV